MSNHAEHTEQGHQAHGAGHDNHNSTKLIWKTFFILLGITIFELVIPFTSINPDVQRYIFIILTIVKAFYIVAYFMHLKFEAKFFRYAMILPFAFIVYLIAISLGEGVAIKHLTDFFPKF